MLPGNIIVQHIETRTAVPSVDPARGTIRRHQRMDTSPALVTFGLWHDRSVIDRVEVNEEATERRTPRYGGENLVVPVTEEMLVTETRLLLREVIRLRDPGEVEQASLSGTVRRDCHYPADRQARPRLRTEKDHPGRRCVFHQPPSVLAALGSRAGTILGSVSTMHSLYRRSSR